MTEITVRVSIRVIFIRIIHTVVKSTRTQINLEKLLMMMVWRRQYEQNIATFHQIVSVTSWIAPSASALKDFLSLFVKDLMLVINSFKVILSSNFCFQQPWIKSM